MFRKNSYKNKKIQIFSKQKNKEKNGEFKVY